MLTEHQFAARAGVSPKTIRRLIDAGRLAAQDFGTGTHHEYRIAEDATVQPKTQAASVPVPVAPVGRRRRLAAAGSFSIHG